MTIGEKIKQFRELKGISQNKLAILLNISRQAVNLWEKNKAQPRLDKIKLLTETLNCNLIDLLAS